MLALSSVTVNMFYFCFMLLLLYNCRGKSFSSYLLNLIHILLLVPPSFFFPLLFSSRFLYLISNHYSLTNSPHFQPNFALISTDLFFFNVPSFFFRGLLTKQTWVFKMRLLCVCGSAFALRRLGRQI